MLFDRCFSLLYRNYCVEYINFLVVSRIEATAAAHALIMAGYVCAGHTKCTGPRHNSVHYLAVLFNQKQSHTKRNKTNL